MEQVQIVAVDGEYCRDHKGRNLMRIGNAPIVAGAYVYTDGQYVYGQYNAPTPPQLPPRRPSVGALPIAGVRVADVRRQLAPVWRDSVRRKEMNPEYQDSRGRWFLPDPTDARMRFTEYSSYGIAMAGIPAVWYCHQGADVPLIAPQQIGEFGARSDGTFNEVVYAGAPHPIRYGAFRLNSIKLYEANEYGELSEYKDLPHGTHAIVNDGESYYEFSDIPTLDRAFSQLEMLRLLNRPSDPRAGEWGAWLHSRHCGCILKTRNGDWKTASELGVEAYDLEDIHAYQYLNKAAYSFYVFKDAAHDYNGNGYDLPNLRPLPPGARSNDLAWTAQSGYAVHARKSIYQSYDGALYPRPHAFDYETDFEIYDLQNKEVISHVPPMRCSYLAICEVEGGWYAAYRGAELCFIDRETRKVKRLGIISFNIFFNRISDMSLCYEPVKI